MQVGFEMSGGLTVGGHPFPLLYRSRANAEKWMAFRRGERRPFSLHVGVTD